MKTIAASEAQLNIEDVLKRAQKERVVLTRAGKPSAVIVGIEGYDDEDLRVASSAEFWQMIEERRTGRSIPLAELRARLRLPSAARTAVKDEKPRRKRNTRSPN